MRNRLAILVLVSAALFFALSCGSDNPEAGPASSALSDLKRVENPSAPSGDLEELVAGNTGFALDLYGRLATKVGNLFISPFSISMALGMMHPGAAGETADEIADALNFTLSPEWLHPAFNALEQLLSNRGADLDEDDKFALEIANSIWGQEGFHIEQPFLDTIAENYGSGIRLVDFAGSPDASRIAINDWVEENTNDRIKDLLLPPDIDEATLMVLVNAIFFKAAWQEPFEKDSDMKFQLLDGTTRTAPGMSRYGQYGFTVGDNYRAVTIPYAMAEASGADTPGVSMMVVLPDAGKFKEFEASLSGEKLDEIRADLARREQVNIELPKFKFESKFHLPKELKELGVIKAFKPGEADFSGIQGISPVTDLYLSDVIHQAFIAVDEEGTEAAAATAVIMKFISGVVHDYTFRANRPFIFMIQDDETGSILFMGRMLNPCAGASMCSAGDVPDATPTPGPTPMPPPGMRLGLAGRVTAYSGVIDGQSDSTVYKVSFDVELRDRYRPIDLTPPYVLAGSCADVSSGQVEVPCMLPQIAPDTGSTTLVTFTDRDQYALNVPWTVDFPDGTSDDFILEGEEQATITVWLMRQKVSAADGGESFTVVGWEPDGNGAHGILAEGGFPLEVSEQFMIEVQPLRTVVLMFQRTLPRRFEAVIDLR